MHMFIYRSEGFPRTGYLIPVRDGAGVWTFGNLPLPAFKQENNSGIIGLVRPAGGHKISLKLINYDVKWTKRFF